MTEKASRCEGVTNNGEQCRRSGRPLCATHREQATAERRDNITPDQAETLYAEYGI